MDLQVVITEAKILHHMTKTTSILYNTVIDFCFIYKKYIYLQHNIKTKKYFLCQILQQK
jgi:hypothetical protein